MLADDSLLPPPASPLAPARSLLPPPGSGAASPVRARIAPPHARFLECGADELRLGEVRELLREYRRLVEDVRAAGGFEGQ
jgi:hypothetical protein